jgi:acyl-CoA synthetase (AMP-forming)/AMP-acid ligase II
MLKVRGFQVAPAELEGCILDHPDVTDTCVVGIQDEYSGELPLAFVVLCPEAIKRVEESPQAADKIKASIMKVGGSKHQGTCRVYILTIQHVADNKVGYKKLAGGVEFIDVVPKNPSGKLLRRVLRTKAREMRTKPKAKL